jgi:hypothetical protein
MIINQKTVLTAEDVLKIANINKNPDYKYYVEIQSSMTIPIVKKSSEFDPKKINEIVFFTGVNDKNLEFKLEPWKHEFRFIKNDKDLKKFLTQHLEKIIKNKYLCCNDEFKLIEIILEYKIKFKSESNKNFLDFLKRSLERYDRYESTEHHKKEIKRIEEKKEYQKNIVEKYVQSLKSK